MLWLKASVLPDTKPGVTASPARDCGVEVVDVDVVVDDVLSLNSPVSAQAMPDLMPSLFIYMLKCRITC